MEARHYLKNPPSAPVDEGKIDTSGCAWTGCHRKGVISPHTHGGKFYCRIHAGEVMGIDFTPNETCKNVSDLMEKKHPGWRL